MFVRGNELSREGGVARDAVLKMRAWHRRVATTSIPGSIVY
jgi:hypothetical protein